MLPIRDTLTRKNIILSVCLSVPVAPRLRPTTAASSIRPIIYQALQSRCEKDRVFCPRGNGHPPFAGRRTINTRWHFVSSEHPLTEREKRGNESERAFIDGIYVSLAIPVLRYRLFLCRFALTTWGCSKVLRGRERGR